MEIKKDYVRVSSIIGQWNKFGAINPEVLNDKANLGTEVHAAIESQEEVFFPLSEKAIGYFDSFSKWVKKTNAFLHTREQRLYCDTLKITGQIDALWQFEGDERLVIVDYKTSASASPKLWELQGMFYHYLCTVNKINVHDRFIFLQLDKEGKMPKAHEFIYDRETMKICLFALSCYRWLKGG